MKRYVILFLMLGGLLAAPLCAQEKPAQPAPAPQAGVPALPVPSAEFLAKYDKFMALGEARASAEKKRAEYEAAAKVLTEQINDLGTELRAEMARVAPGHQFDPARRAFIKLPAPPAAPKEK